MKFIQNEMRLSKLNFISMKVCITVYITYIYDYNSLFIQRKTAALPNKSTLCILFLYVSFLVFCFKGRKLPDFSKILRNRNITLYLRCFPSNANKEDLTTTRSKLLILPSLRLHTLVDYVSLIIDLVVRRKTFSQEENSLPILP